MWSRYSPDRKGETVVYLKPHKKRALEDILEYGLSAVVPKRSQLWLRAGICLDIYWGLRPAPRDSHLIGLGYSWGLRTFKTTQWILTGSKIWKPFMYNPWPYLKSKDVRPDISIF